MDIVVVCLAVCLACILICFILIWYVTTYNKYQEYIIRINEAEANIDSILRKRFDLLNKATGIIKPNTEDGEEVLVMIDKLRSKKISNFDLDRVLYDALNEFQAYAEKYSDLTDNDEFIKIELNLNESESEITALRKYYNDIITSYNKLVKKFPSNIIGLFSKFKSKTYYDGKNMEDDIINDFKL